MTIVNDIRYPKVAEIVKITDTEIGNGTYDLEVKIQFTPDEEPELVNYRSSPTDPHGVNPSIRNWLSENPDVPVHAYVPPPEPTIEELRARMPTLTARQLRLGLVHNGFSMSQVSAVIEGMPEGADKETARIEWEYATTFERPHPLIATVGTALGISEDQIDTMWEAAANL